MKHEVDEKLTFINICLHESVYPLKFIEMYAISNLLVKYDAMEKKICILYLHFKGDGIAGINNHMINVAILAGYSAASLMTLSETNYSLKNR